MSTSTSPSSNADDLTTRRQKAAKVLWWRALGQGALQALFIVLLAADLLLGARLVLGAATDSPNVVELGSRLFGDAEEAAWLGWLTTFAWFFGNRMNQARLNRRGFRLAREMLRSDKPEYASKWFLALP